MSPLVFANINHKYAKGLEVHGIVNPFMTEAVII